MTIVPYEDLMKTIIVWYRNDLRIHDHPALAAACDDGQIIIPVFILNKTILTGKHAGSNRNRFLLECLQDLKKSLKKIGADLVVREGDSENELKKLVKEFAADALYYTSDYSPYAQARDKNIDGTFSKQGIQVRAFAGRLILQDVKDIETKTGGTYKVFTPFYKNWLESPRRKVVATPTHISFPLDANIGDVPTSEYYVSQDDLSPYVLHGGESEARKKLVYFLQENIHDYHKNNNDMAADSTSRLSSYIHFGCLSPREIETMLPDGDGPRAWQRQLCWRDFYHYILLHYPQNATEEYQERYRKLAWGDDKKMLRKWQSGETGYPIVDAAMRQLRDEGWMHNRARLIVGSFLTKDLWIDWRIGETYFMRMLVDGDEANNNGNWQWIASVGVDPAPLFRRLYNPVSQHKTYDSTSEYVRRYVPELRSVPNEYIFEPWRMSEVVQIASKCVIDTDYPSPIVDHRLARLKAIENYRSSQM